MDMLECLEPWNLLRSLRKQLLANANEAHNFPMVISPQASNPEPKLTPYCSDE